MRAAPPLRPRRVPFLRRMSQATSLAACLLATGCVEHSTGPRQTLTARLALGTHFPQATSSQAVHLDSWRLQVTRPGEGVIGEESGSVTPGQSAVDVEITVELDAMCESLEIQIELSALGEVWFRSQESHLICSQRQSEIQVQEMQWVRPTPTISPGNLGFTLQEGQAGTGAFTIHYGGSDGLTWTAWVEEPSVEWVTLQPASGSAPGGQPTEVQVLVDAASLAPGDYSAHIAVAGEGFPELIARIPLTLSVTPGPRLGVSPTSLSFSVLEGSTLDPQIVAITNQGGGTLNWTAFDNAGWLALAPSSGSLGPGSTQAVTVTASADGLAPGTYDAVITVSGEGAGDSPQAITVTLEKTASPRMGLSAGILSFTAEVGVDPAPQVVTITNEGGGSLDWSATADMSWITLSPENGALGAGLGQPVTVSVNSASLDPGDYLSTLTFNAPGAENSPQTVAVNLSVVGDVAPTISGLSWDQLVLNDPTCGNDGTRFELSFDFSDLDGDVLIEGDSLAGNPINVDWWFRPDGFSGSAPLTGAVDGTEFSGTVTFQMCIAYQVPENTSVDLTFTLEDDAGHVSNSRSTNIPRPDGGNVAPPTVPPETGMGSLAPARKAGSVLPSTPLPPAPPGLVRDGRPARRSGDM